MLRVESACTNPLDILEKGIIPAVREAGKIVKAGYDTGLFEVHEKSSCSDLVTEIDFESSRLIRKMLSNEFPGIRIIDEENNNGAEIDLNGQAFVVDPLDGTLNFSHGLDLFCVSIGYIEEGKPAVGAVYLPISGDLYYGINGKGAWKNSERIHVNENCDLKSCLLASGIPYDKEIRKECFLNPVSALLNEVQEIRLLGSAAIALCLVAEGSLSGYFEFGLSPWDVAGGLAVALGAGCSAFAIRAKDDLLSGKSIICGNQILNRRILAFL